MYLTLSELAILAQQAYWSAPEQQESSKSSSNGDNPKRFYFSSGSCQGYVERVGGFGVIAFRGTDSLDDWASNLDIGRCYSSGVGTVHEGFAEALDSGLSAVEEAWLSAGFAPWHIPMRGHGAPIICTGHSLGGALALLMAGRCRLRSVAAVTFGCPRVLSAWSDATPGFPVWNVVYRYDIVPRIPKVGFTHFGQTLYWGCGPVSRFFWRPVVRGYNDHKMSRYINHVLNNPDDDAIVCYDGVEFRLAGGLKNQE